MPWLAVAFVVLWALWAALFNTAQFGDNLEQFNWTHSLEWGYFKHPPMPTWLLGGLIHLFGPWRWWAVTLAALCAIATAALTWDIARQLLGVRAAAAALLLWSLQQCFAQRVQLYNHNTVLMLFIAAAVWSALRARRGGPAWWAATGLFAGAALLSKYQAAVPLAGLLATLAWTGQLKGGAQRRGLVLAVALALVAFAPHIVWVMHHNYTTLRYASQSFEPEGGGGHRLWVLGAFALNQLRMVFAALVTALVCGLLMRGRTVPQTASEAASAMPPTEVRAWMIGLLWGPLALLALLALAGGITLRNHWGVQTMQFLSLWLVWRWPRALSADPRRLVAVGLVMHLLSLALYAVQQRDPDAILSSRRMDTVYPAQRMADVAMAEWHKATHCPLHYVAGPSFQAGLVSLYSGGTAVVVEDSSESPWVDPAQMLKEGTLYVVEGDEPLPDGVTAVRTLPLAPPQRAASAVRTITFGIRPPQVPCR